MGIAAVIGVVVSQNLHRIIEKTEDDTLLLRVLHFLFSGGQLLHGAAIDDRHFLGTQTERGSRGVHGHVAAANHGHASRTENGGGGIFSVGLHEVGAGQKFVGGIDTLEGFAGDTHKLGKSRTRANENSLKAFLEQLVHGHGLTDDHVGLDGHAHGAQAVHLLLHDVLGETEFGDAVHENAARHVESFVHGHLIAASGQSSRAGQSRRTPNRRWRPYGRSFRAKRDARWKRYCASQPRNAPIGQCPRARP